MNPLYQLHNVCVTFKGLKVLDKISFELFPEEVFCITGPNGSGKTTLLKTMLGLLLPSEGKVIYKKKPVSESNSTEFDVGYLPQLTSYEKLDHKLLLPVREVVELGYTRQSGKKARKESIDRTLELLNLTGLEKKLFASLSGGQKQKVLTARALVNRPSLLMLDEPSTGVDSESKDNLYELLKVLNRTEKITLVIVTHEINLIPMLATKVGCLNVRMFIHENPDEFAKCPVMQDELNGGLEILMHGKNIPHRLVLQHNDKNGEKHG